MSSRLEVIVLVNSKSFSLRLAYSLTPPGARKGRKVNCSEGAVFEENFGRFF